jgi:hypothetical protein
LHASKRKKRNRIARLRRGDGSVTEDGNEMSGMARSFYQTLYSTEGTTSMTEVLDSVPVSVSHQMNGILTAPFEDVEVKTALFQMYPLKAPDLMDILHNFSRITRISVERRLLRQYCGSFVVRTALWV